MKKKMGLLDKIRIFRMWLKEKDGVMVRCQYCNSIHITFISMKDEGNIYNSRYKCLDCGATAKNTEIWSENI